jgi:hypothetical protein
MSDIDINEWVQGISVVTEDHIFTPIGSQSDRMTELLNERAALLENIGKSPELGEDEVPGEHAVGEHAIGESYTARRDELDKEIQAQLEADHPDAPRIQLRGLSDEDIEEIQDEVLALEVEGKKLDARKGLVETNLRMVSRASVSPHFSPQDVRILRKRLNAGEWARLLDHCTRLMTNEAEAVDLPSS